MLPNTMLYTVWLCSKNTHQVTRIRCLHLYNSKDLCEKKTNKFLIGSSSSLRSVIMLMIIIVMVNQSMTGVDLVEGCRGTHSPPLLFSDEVSRFTRLMY